VEAVTSVPLGCKRQVKSVIETEKKNREAIDHVLPVLIYGGSKYVKYNYIR